MLHKYHILFSLLLILLIAGCNKEENPTDSQLPNETESLVKYLESNGDYLNTIAPALISAQQVREDQLNRTPLLIFDVRSECDYFTKGHIEGAVLIKIKDIPWYYRNNDGASKKVIVTCGSGQEASYAVALLRYYGYNNVYCMTWGMSAWNSNCDVWSSQVGDGCAASFETKMNNKPAAGKITELHTGKTKPEDILSERVKLLMNAGFEDAVVSSYEVLQNPSNYFVINYSSLESYMNGHLKDAVYYALQKDLKLSESLNTLPQEKIIAVYCNTGHTSAHAAAYLKMLGYNAKTILFGNNGMNYSSMSGKKFTSADMHDYPIIH